MRAIRRKIGAADVFTAFYTTILATAAVADAGDKERRRNDLDLRIVQARRDLARVLQESSRVDCSLVLNVISSGTLSAADDGPRIASPVTSPFGVIEGLKAVCVPAAQLWHYEDQTKRRRAYISWLHEQFGLRRRWPPNQLPANAWLKSVEEGLMREERASVDASADEGRSLPLKQREPRSPVQFERMTEATNRLADELMTEAHRLGHPDDEASFKASMESLDSPWMAIRMLRSDGYPKYRHPELDPAETTAARLDANDAARSIFAEWRYMAAHGPKPQRSLFGSTRAPPADWYRKQIKFWVSKLCYNLLVNSAPPGILNYNTLILGFTRVQEHSLAQLVVGSLLYQTRMLPTQQTLVCLLHHYRAQRDAVGFYRILRRLVALDARGAKIRRRAVGDVLGRPLQMEWAQSQDVALTDGYVVQRAWINVPVFHAIVKGLLSLGQVRHAAVVAASMLADCDAIRPGWINHLANRVLDAIDIPAARALLHALAENARLITPLLLGDDSYASRLTRKVHLLTAVAGAREPALQLSSRPEQQQQQDSNSYEPAQSTADGGERLSRALFVSSALQYVSELGRVLDSVQAVLEKDFMMLSGTSSALSDLLASLDARPDKLAREQALYRRMAQLKAADEAVETVYRACARLMEQFFAVVVPCLDVPAAVRVFLQSAWLPFGLRFASYRAMARASAMADADGTSAYVAQLERSVAVDAPAVGDVLEDRLKEILLLPLSPRERAAAGLASGAAWIVRSEVRNVSLDVLVAARGLKTSAGAAQSTAAREEEKNRQGVQFLARTPRAIFRVPATDVVL